MSADPVVVFRNELRGAAERRIRLREQYRRIVIVLVAAASAVLIVGGAIAASTGWLSADSSGEIQVHVGRRVFDHLTPQFKACMAARGARPVRVQGGFVFPRSASAETACGAYVSEITLTCQRPQRPAGQAVSGTTQCASVAHMNAAQPLRLRKEKRK